MSTLHIRCGSDIRQGLQRAGLQGDFLEFADPFCVGPLARLPLEAHVRSRAQFVATAFGIDEADALARLRREYGALESLYKYRRIVLWFEHDSYDQLILAYLLKRLGELRLDARVELIAADGAPGVERFIGIGQLSPDLLGWLWRQRVPVGQKEFELGRRVWQALTAATPEPLYDIASSGTPAIGLMAPALLRHLRELPDLRTGLSLTERLTMEIVRDQGPLRAASAFRALTLRYEPLPYLGDTLFRWIIQGMADGDAAVLRLDPIPDEESWFRRTIRLTPVGWQVLHGHLNRLALAPRPRWVGAVAVPGASGCWCWDAARGRPAKG